MIKYSFMFIDGFSFTSYRSFDGEFQRIGPLGKVNLLVGQNNSGKSNTLLFLKNDFGDIVRGTLERGVTVSRGVLDIPQGQLASQIRCEIGLTLGGPNHDYIIDRCKKEFKKLSDAYHENDRQLSLNFVQKLLTSPLVSKDGKMAWFEYEAPSQTNSLFTFKQEFIDALCDEFRNLEQEARHTWRTLDFANNASHSRQNLKAQLLGILNFIGPHNLPVPEIHLIPAIRQVGEAGSDYSDFGGVGIIRRLHRLQNPPYDQQSLKASFKKINQFLKSITGNSSAELEIPLDEKMVIVHMDGKTLPLSSLGTGIHQMIILAAAATVLEKHILCIEEPELHLHPLLQRKLVNYLQQETDNQYFLTTHSAHLLDAPNVRIFHVQLNEGRSKITSALSPSARTAICADLGYRASDLVQANSVIWVEGPSDRIYLRHWIKEADPTLIEGVHYSIMFYGGRLLSNLTANDPEIDDFISLRRLNRYISIVIDSDKKNAQSPINETKKRIISEFNLGPGFAWVTAGREIENYFDGNDLWGIVRTIHPSAQNLVGIGRYEKQSCYVSKNVSKKKTKSDVKNNKEEKPKDPEIDKIKVAHSIIANTAIKPTLDYSKQIKQMVRFIREANDL